MRKSQRSPSHATPPPVPSRLCVVAFDGISPFHLSVPCLVFGEHHGATGAPEFSVQICAAENRPLKTSAGFTIQAGAPLSALRQAEVIFVPTWRDANERPPQELLAALQKAHRRGALLVGLCLGAFVLAHAGVLDGRSATTHWSWSEDFARRFTAVNLDAAALYVDDGQVVTSAGTAAALDCCLYLLRKWCGSDVANRVARRLVIAPHRNGGQAQFIEQPVPRMAADDRLRELLEWVNAHLKETHGIDALAARVSMGRRTFTRHFQKMTGTTVLQWLTHQRLARACQLLENTSLTVEAVAVEAGFGSAVVLRQRFGAVYRLSPSDYRRQYRTA